MSEKLMEVESPQILPGEVDSPLRFQRFAHALTNRLRSAGVKITAEVQEDGRVALIMPLEWAQIFLARFAVEVDSLKEELRKATRQIQRREAEMRIASGEAEQKWQREQEQVHLSYNRLRKEGHSRREALHRLKADRGDLWTVTMLDQTIALQGAKERRQHRAELEARIQRKAEHLTQKEIAEQEGLTLHQIKWAVQKGRATTRSHGSRPMLTERRDMIRALSKKGLRPKEIAATLSTHVQKVYDTRRERGTHNAKADSDSVN